MKKVLGAIMALFALVAIVSCEVDSGDSSSSEPEFDVTLCNRSGDEKSEFTTNDDGDVEFYITSENYLDRLNVPEEGSYVDSNDNDKDVTITFVKNYDNYGTKKYSISGLPNVAGTYDVTFRVNRLDDGKVNKNVYKDITLSAKVAATTAGYDAPTITTQPADITYDAGTTTFNTALTVVATVSNGSVSYQWYKAGEAISGATDASYTPTDVTTSSTEYYVIVSNKNDTTKTTKSNVVIVRVKVDGELDAPKITKNLATSVSYDKVSEIAELSIQATVTSGEPSYQWYKDGKAISGATKSSYTPQTFGSYYVKVWAVEGSNTSAEVNSNTIVISENAISIKSSLSAESAYVGTQISVSCSVNVDTSNVEYQWYSTDESSGSLTEISGETKSTYTPTKAGKYTCKVTATSKYTGESKTVANAGTCTVTVKTADDPATPTITSNLPAAKSITEGEDVTFSVTASTTDEGTLSYQWYKGGATLSCTSSSYTISSSTTDDSGEYYVAVTNTLNGKTAKVDSVHCTLTVNSKETTGSGSGSFQF